MFPGQRNRHHWPFDDPAHAQGTDEQILTVFRRVRDEIRAVFTAYAAGRVDESKSGSGAEVGKDREAAMGASDWSDVLVRAKLVGRGQPPD